MRVWLLILLYYLAIATPALADTFVIPFSDVRQEIDAAPDDPDAVIRAYLAQLIRHELDDAGFNVDGGLVFGEIPLDEMTERIADHCYVPSPYKVHTDATTATVTFSDSSSITVGLESIRSIDVIFDLIGLFQTAADAWVRWGQDVPFVGSCKTISTDNGWVGLDILFTMDLDVQIDLDPVYDTEQVAIVVDKQATVAGNVQFHGGDLDHDFGTASPTDIVLDVFEDRLLDELSTEATQDFNDEMIRLNYRLDGLDENGLPDPTVEAFNAPSTFTLTTTDEDQGFIRDLLAQLGVPERVLAMVDERGVEILLQLIVLEGDERDTYLATLGAEVGCDALLGTYQVSLSEVPLYTQGVQGCEIANLKAPPSVSYFSDAACANEVAFVPTDDAAYCQAQFGPDAESILGNAASWVPDIEQPGDKLPGVASRAWTTVPTSELDIGTVSLVGNNQPFMKQVDYKTIAVARGTGTCRLEMRVYKRDITEQGLRPAIALHGGTWQSRGSSFMGLEAGISQLTERGFIVFAPFYRLVGDKDGNTECNGASWREVIDDTESALDWVNQYGAALGATAGSVTVFGQSAGAHLAAWLAANRSAEIRKALLYYGPTDALEFLQGALPPGGPYDAYREFGLRALERFFGAYGNTSDLDLSQIDFGGVTVSMLATDWHTLIPAAVFDLTLVDPLLPPVYVARCATSTGTDLAAINLAQPPTGLVSCMKQELRDFLIANSFNHQLDDETVPVFVVHGSGDAIVPHAQAVNLCAAIDDSVLPVDAIDPLTVYSCGIQSEIQVPRDADHALDLGFCAEPVCPAGSPGSETRVATEAAINASYAWLVIDDSDRDGVPDSEDAFPNDPTETVDTDSDGIGDNADSDDDGDGLSDAEELVAGTDPTNADTDRDSVSDGADNCGLASNPDQLDADADGIGNVCDDSNAFAKADFDGDGKSDLLWRHSASGQNRVHVMDGPVVAADSIVNTVSDLSWQIAGTGDYDANGSADILWRNALTGQNWIYLMDGAAIVASLSVSSVPAAWIVVGTGDHNGDGKSDILWRNSATGQNWLHVMDGPAIASSVAVNTVPAPWSVAGTGDFDGDGRSDILWRNPDTGQNWMYLMDGASVVASLPVNVVGSEWQIAATSDFNGDGRSDIFWRHSATGKNWFYMMNGANIVRGMGLPSVPIDWRISATGDYNGDGVADIVWTNADSGQTWMYLIRDGGIALSSQLNGVTAADWRLAPDY